MNKVTLLKAIVFTSMALILPSCGMIGDPISSTAARMHLRTTLKKEIPDTKLSLGSTSYNWKTGGYSTAILHNGEEIDTIRTIGGTSEPQPGDINALKQRFSGEP